MHHFKIDSDLALDTARLCLIGPFPRLLPRFSLVLIAIPRGSAQTPLDAVWKASV